MDKDSIIFGEVSFSNVLKDIYVNSTDKRQKIELLLEDLRGLVKNVNDAVLVVPLIKEYLDVSVKNDEQLVKMATIVQKLLVDPDSGVGGLDGLLSAEEKTQLLSDVKMGTKELEEKNKETNDKIGTLENKKEKIEEKIKNE